MRWRDGQADGAATGRLCVLAGLVLCLLLLARPLGVPPAWGYQDRANGILSMRFEDGLLTLEATDAPLDKLLREVARLTGVTIVVDGPLQGKVSVWIERLPLDKALRKILRGKDVGFLYAPSPPGSAEGYVLSEVRVYLPSKEKGAPLRFSYGPKPPRRPSRPPRPRHAPPRPRRPAAPERGASGASSPAITSPEEADRILRDLVGGDIDGLAEMAERMKEANPNAEEQIDRFLDSLEEARRKAEESGLPMVPPGGPGNMMRFLEQLHRDQAAPGD